MNIILLNNQENLYKVDSAGRYAVEYYKNTSLKGLIDIRLYDAAENRLYEISPDKKKVSAVEVCNCIWNSKDVYFSTCDVQGTTQIEISIYKYDTENMTESRLCSFTRNIDLLDGDKKIKAFVLNESTILVQTELLHSIVDARRMGTIEFQLELYNIETGTGTPVKTANFVNNGINSIIPLSESRIVIKTGYSCLEDQRVDDSNEEEALIESIFFTTTARFIADILLANDTVEMHLIESAYYDRHLTMPYVSGDYIHFTVVDVKNQQTRCVFYNYLTDEQTEYMTGSITADDLYVTYVIGGSPYVRQTTEDQVNFINLKKADIDISFYEESFIRQLGPLFIMRSLDKKAAMHIYSYPKLNRELDTIREYGFSCMVGEDCLIYC